MLRTIVEVSGGRRGWHVLRQPGVTGLGIVPDDALTCGGTGRREDLVVLIAIALLAGLVSIPFWIAAVMMWLGWEASKQEDAKAAHPGVAAFEAVTGRSVLISGEEIVEGGAVAVTTADGSTASGLVVSAEEGEPPVVHVVK